MMKSKMSNLIYCTYPHLRQPLHSFVTVPQQQQMVGSQLTITLYNTKNGLTFTDWVTSVIYLQLKLQLLFSHRPLLLLITYSVTSGRLIQRLSTMDILPAHYLLEIKNSCLQSSNMEVKQRKPSQPNKINPVVSGTTSRKIFSLDVTSIKCQEESGLGQI